MDLMDLMDLGKNFVVKKNGEVVKGVGRVDIIIEAEKPLKVQILRLEPKTLERVVEEVEPYEAIIDSSIGVKRLTLKASPFKQKIISRIKDLVVEEEK